MMGLFCGSKASNNEAYKKIIRQRMRIMLLLFILGSITLAVSLLAKNLWLVKIDDRMLGVYTGAGAGLSIVAIVIWIRNKLILSDENKIKNDRLSNTDERLQEISRKAFRAATAILLISLYAAGLIGGLFYPILVKVLFILISIFLFVYVLSYKIYERGM